MSNAPRHARPEPRVAKAALTNPMVAAGVVDPADIPQPVGEVPAFVAVPSQARQVLRDAGLDVAVFDESLARAHAEERLATALARTRAAADRVVEAACAWREGHPDIDLFADDYPDRRAKERDLLEAVREYEEVAP